MATTLAPATLAALILGARQRAGLVNSGAIASGASSEEETMAQASAQALHSILVQCDPDAYATTVALAAVSTAAPFIDWATPTDFGWLRKVTYPLNGQPHRVDRLTLDQFIEATASGQAATFPRGYFRQRGLIRFAPGLSAATPVPVIYHIPGQVALGGVPAVTFDGVDGWDAWIEIDMAIRMRTKIRRDPGHLLAEREKVEDRIKSQAMQRDVGEPPHAVDTDAGFDFPFGVLPPP